MHAASPIRRAIDDVQHAAVVSIDDVEHTNVARQRPDVERLPAGRRIERRAIEDERGLPLVRHGVLDDVRVELPEVRIG